MLRAPKIIRVLGRAGTLRTALASSWLGHRRRIAAVAGAPYCHSDCRRYCGPPHPVPITRVHLVQDKVDPPAAPSRPKGDTVAQKAPGHLSVRCSSANLFLGIGGELSLAHVNCAQQRRCHRARATLGGQVRGHSGIRRHSRKDTHSRPMIHTNSNAQQREPEPRHREQRTRVLRNFRRY